MPTPPTVERLLAIAASYLGQGEQPPGSNRGAFVEACQRVTSTAPGQPWCGCFVARCLKEAGYPLGARPWLLASARYWFDPRSGGVPVHPADVRPGDCFGVPFGHAGPIKHVGLVVRVEGDRIHTIEGNTNQGGSREGTGVFRRNRHRAGLFFSRWTTIDPKQ